MLTVEVIKKQCKKYLVFTFEWGSRLAVTTRYFEKQTIKIALFEKFPDVGSRESDVLSLALKHNMHSCNNP